MGWILGTEPVPPTVAAQVLRQEVHQVNLEECRLRVQVQPLELPMVTSVQVT